jgi:hypothetical protein
MLFPITFFLFFLAQTSFSQNCFDTCLKNHYCEKVIDKYECLVCPLDKICRGDGYARPLSNNSVTNSPYYVVSKPIRRELFRKKLKRIVKIVKVGLKVAAIVKTGGVAGLKVVAAQKIKDFAIKKGIQCLRNGLSNFCNGKKGAKVKLGTKKSAVKIVMMPKNLRGFRTKAKALKSRVKTKFGSKLRTKAKALKSKIKTKVGSKLRAKAKALKSKIKTKVGSKLRAKAKELKSRIGSRFKAKAKALKSKNTKFLLCKHIFDNVANKLKNVTRHVADDAVNKGRDWLKNRFGDNCIKRLPKDVPSLRKKKKGNTKQVDTNPTTIPDDNIKPVKTSTDDSTTPSRPVQTKPPTSTTRPPRIIRTRPPTSTDDSTRSSRTVRTKRPINTDDITRPPRIIRTKPPTSTDDSTIPPRIIRTKPPTSTDDSTRPPMLVRTRRPFTTHDSIRPPRKVIPPRPVQRSPQTPLSKLKSAKTTTRPSRQPTVRPTKQPTVRPTMRPTVSPTQRPTVSPTMRPTVSPTQKPTLRPTIQPTVSPTQQPTIQQLSWAAFSFAPTVFTNIPPTRTPTKSMFTVITPPPQTNSPSLRATPVHTSKQTVNPTIKHTHGPTSSPTVGPSPNPTQIPTPSQTNIITSSTFSPSTSTTMLSLSSNSQSAGKTTNTNIIVAIVLSCIVLILFAMACFYIIKNKTAIHNTAYDKWTDYYGQKNQQPPRNNNIDIHHFYSKSAPPFKPHISVENKKRYSANPQRLSLSPSRRSSMNNVL